MENEILLEETMVAALEALDGMSKRVCPVVDIKKSNGPLVVYDQRSETGEQELEGDTELLTAVFQIHVLHGTYRQMRQLCGIVKGTLKGLRGTKSEALHIEALTLEQATPDILEEKVGLFRRTYNVIFFYQIKEE